jgi:hypothetical protein
MNQFINRIWLGYGVAALICLLLAAAIAMGQSPRTPPPDRGDVILSGFLSCHVAKDSPRQCPFRLHYVDLKEGQTYAIRIESTEFEAGLAIEDMHGNVLATDGDCVEEDLFGCIWFRAPSTDSYRLVVTASSKMREGFYSVTVREMPIVMRVEASLTMTDKTQDECYQKVHDVTLNAGQRYVIELASKEFTPGLKLLNAEGAIVAFDDEGNTTNPARIFYTAPETGTYRLVTASTTRFSVGPFTLTVLGDE